MIRVEIRVILVQVPRTCLTVAYSSNSACGLLSQHVLMYDVMWSAHSYKWNTILNADFIHRLQDILYSVNKMDLCFTMRTGTFSCEVC